MPFPSPEDLPDPGIKPGSPALQADSLPAELRGKPSGGDEIPAELFEILKDGAVKVPHSICQQIWKAQQWPQDWKRSVFIPILKKGNAKGCSNYYTMTHFTR